MTQEIEQRLHQRLRALGTVRVTILEKPRPCPVCGEIMGIQKTVHRTGRTLEHGPFEARESIYACMGGCRWPSDLRVIQRSSTLAEQLLPHSGIGYDVMTFIGIERFIHFRQRNEIRANLHKHHGLAISAGEVSRLSRLFLVYLERLHEARSGALHAALKADGGWPLHIDATGEDGRGTLFVAMAGWRNWVLGSYKIPTEHADAILPHLRTVVARFGVPCAIVRDLGRAMTRAALDLVGEIRVEVPILACHLHFLADIGKDLLDSSHRRLRELFREFNIRPRLRTLSRELGRALGHDIVQARLGLTAWQKDEEQALVIPPGGAGLATVRALAQWVLDYSADGSDKGFPFDQPYLNFYKRCIRVAMALGAFLRKPPQDRKVQKALGELHTILNTCVDTLGFGKIARTLERRISLFEELRAALRLNPKPSRRNDVFRNLPGGEIETLTELDEIREAVDTLATSLRGQRPQRGPAQSLREAIDLILRHLEVHGANLWGHAVKVQNGRNECIRFVDRTNNSIESFFHLIKRGERRRSGRKILTNDFETMPAAAALARNLEHPDYVALLCGTLEALPLAFAGLDSESEQQRLQLANPILKGGIPISTTESASLSREDRIIVRSEPMQRKINAAAEYRTHRTPVLTPQNIQHI